ncbi:MAG: hypothetical protein AB1805_10535 [Nitrospirota bacterium]
MDFCDLDCRYAAFPKSDAVDGSRSCRTFIALECTLKKKLVHKNLPCADKEARWEKGKSGSARKRKTKRA